MKIFGLRQKVHVFRLSLLVNPLVEAYHEVYSFTLRVAKQIKYKLEI